MEFVLYMEIPYPELLHHSGSCDDSPYFPPRTRRGGGEWKARRGFSPTGKENKRKVNLGSTFEVACASKVEPSTIKLSRLILLFLWGVDMS